VLVVVLVLSSSIWPQAISFANVPPAFWMSFGRTD